MEKKNNNGVIIGILIGLIITLIIVAGLFITGIIGFKEKITTDNVQVNNNSNNETTTTNDNQTENNTYDAETIAKEKIPAILSLINQSNGGYTYCGDVESSNFSNNNYYTYYVSTKFNTLNELKEYLNTVSTSTIYNKYLKTDSDSYVEKDNKLYCAWIGSGKDYAVFSTEKGIKDLNNVSYTITNKENDNFTTEVTVKIGEKVNNYNFSLTKQNGNWIINSFEEK